MNICAAEAQISSEQARMTLLLTFSLQFNSVRKSSFWMFLGKIFGATRCSQSLQQEEHDPASSLLIEMLRNLCV